MEQNEVIRNQIKLHFVVFIWGFTGVLGKLISIDGEPLAWIRMGLAFVGLALFMLLRKISFKTDFRTILKFIGIGLIVAVHWATFFMAIKASNVSVALVCMSSSALFMSFLEPLILKRRIDKWEIFFGLIVIGALVMIFEIEPQYKLGIALALTSAFLAALFTALNAIYIKEHNATKITTYEMLGGFLGLSAFMFISGNAFSEGSIPQPMDWIYLLILSLLCTAYAFVVSVDIMKVVSPFTVAISVNLEPIYAILMALVIFGEEEHMSAGFYTGAAVLILTILANAFMKGRQNKKLRAA